MPVPVSVATRARNGRQRPNLAAVGHLTVIPGGRNQREMVVVARGDVEEARLEHIALAAERVAYTGKVRDLLRTVGSHMAREHYAAAATSLLELLRLNEQEAHRALSLSVEPCPCGHDGAGHGPATDDALAVPVEQAA